MKPSQVIVSPTTALPHTAPQVRVEFVVVLMVTACAVPDICCRVTAVAEVGMSIEPCVHVVPLDPMVRTSSSAWARQYHA